MRSASLFVFSVYITLVLIPLIVVPAMMWVERRRRNDRGVAQ
jgi:hypothetical protein